MSTTSRILIAFLLLLAFGLWLLEGQLSLRVERQYLEAVEEPMVDMAHLFASLAEQQILPSGELDLTAVRRAWQSATERRFEAQIYSMTKTHVDAHLYITDRRGVVLFDSNGGRAEGQNYRQMRDVALTLAGYYGARATRLDPADQDSETMFVAAPIRRGTEIIGVASVSKPVISVQPFREETRRWMRNLGWVFLAVLTAGAYFIVTHFSRPIRRLTSYALAVARGERAEAPTGGTAEVAALGQAFETMRDAVDGRSYVEQYVQTLTHEMKSPVAAIRGAVELLREGEVPAERRERFLANIQAEADRLQASIERLLALSALESKKTLEQPQFLDVGSFVQEIYTQLQLGVEARGVELKYEAGVPVVVKGEPYLIAAAVTNVVQNAVDFSVEKSVVKIRVARSERTAEIIVEDEGPGIPEYALPRIFERFYSLQRPATGRKSSGLGLCFVKEAVELHGGSVAITNRTDGRGVRAVLCFPTVG